MNKKKAIKILSATAVAASAFVATAPAQEASASSNVESLVKKAKEAGTVLKWAISTEGSADGKTRPWAEYNAAKDARDKAVAAVSKLPAAQKNAYMADIEQNVNLHINRTMYYIDAITAGEKINEKKATLEAQIEKNLIDDNTEAAYHALSNEIRKQAILLDRVYGKTTRDEIRANYKEAAEKVRDSVKFEVSAKIELDKAKKAIEANDTVAAEKHLAEAKKYMTDVKNEVMKASLVKTQEEIAAQLTLKVKSVSAINSTQAVVTFDKEIAETAVANFTVDNDLTVVKAEINADNKKEVKLTFNEALADKETYKVTVNGVKPVVGAGMKEAAVVEFKYEVGDVSTIALTKSTFINGDKIADSVKLTNAKGTDVTDKYSVEITSTSGKVTSTAGTVSAVTEKEVAYVQVVVKDATNTVVKTSEPIKVNLSTSAVTSLVGFGLGADVATVSAYKQAVKDSDLTSEMKKSATPNLELLVNNNGSEQLVAASDVTKIENLTPSIANVSKSDSNLVVTAYSTGTAQVKLTIGDFVTTVSFTVKADSKISDASLEKSSVYFNTADKDVDGTSALISTDSVDVKMADQYGKDMAATVAANGEVSVNGSVVGTLTAKSSNTNVATVAVDTTATATTSLPITITEKGKGSSTITVEFKDTKGAVVFTKTLTVTGKDAGAFAGYAIDTDATEIDLDKDVTPEANDDVVNFTVYEVDAQGNKIKPVAATLEIQGYDKDPKVKTYINVTGQAVQVTNSNATAYKTFAEAGTLNVDVKVNGTKIGTKAITYKNTDNVATTATINTVDVVIDNDKIGGTTDQTLNLSELLFGHYDAVNNKYTIAPKLAVHNQSSSVIEFDTTAAAGTLLNTDVVNLPTFTTTNVSDSLTVTATTATLNAGKTSGSFTVVVSDIDTASVIDILKAPVAFKVTIVD